MKYSFFITLCFMSLFLICCNQNQTLSDKKNRTFLAYRLDFDTGFSNQFPIQITSDEYYITRSTDTHRNNVGVYLYEFNINSIELKKIISTVKKISIANYLLTDSCLLVVNSLATSLYTRKFFIDSTLINKGCLSHHFPIPNFKLLEDFPKKGNFQGIDTSFSIFIIEANQNNKYKTPKYTLKPDAEMPLNWKNGYSKGVAISIKNNTVIYWSIMW